VVLEVNVRESLRQDAAGPGCERHKGDPHNLCPECWKLEPDVKPSLFQFREWLAFKIAPWVYVPHREEREEAFRDLAEIAYLSRDAIWTSPRVLVQTALREARRPSVASEIQAMREGGML